MGTITARKRNDNTVGYTAQIRLKKGGKVIHTESQTFDREQAAKAWLKKRETELAQPGALDKPDDPTLSEVINTYNADTRREHGKTKTQVLKAIQASNLGPMKCSEIKSQHIIEFAQSLEVQPQTVGNYLAHLASVFTVARPAWGYPLDRMAMEDARVVAQRMGIVSRSNQRDRRPTLDELDKLLTHFNTSKRKQSNSIPMVDAVLFAIFSTRRLEEITRITWEDLDRKSTRILVRDLKHPGEKIGNNQWCELVPEAMEIIDAQSGIKTGPIFPFNGESISTNFTRACKFLGINDLHFHDLRHHGISRLFEMGRNIPQVAAVSAHRTWTSLKRYTHLSQDGDCMQNLTWRNRLASANGNKLTE